LAKGKAAYVFGQSDAHLAILDGFKELAAGLGIRVHAASPYKVPVPRDKKRKLLQWRVWIGGPNLSSFQSYLALPRKRLPPLQPTYDTNLRRIQIARLDHPVMGRTIRARWSIDIHAMLVRRQVIRGQLEAGSIVEVWATVRV
jgi:hypothetical protein